MLIPLASIPDLERACRARSLFFRGFFQGASLSHVVLTDENGTPYRGKGVALTDAFQEAFAEYDRRKSLHAAVRG